MCGFSLLLYIISFFHINKVLIYLFQVWYAVVVKGKERWMVEEDVRLFRMLEAAFLFPFISMPFVTFSCQLVILVFTLFSNLRFYCSSE